MQEVKPNLSTLSFVGFYVNAAISKGHLKAVSFDEIYKGLEESNLFEFLDNRIPGEFDFSLFKPSSEQSNGFHQVLNNAAGELEGRERRKLGLGDSNHGLSLLLSLILEAMQHKEWV